MYLKRLNGLKKYNLTVNVHIYKESNYVNTLCLKSFNFPTNIKLEQNFDEKSDGRF